ncbi:hypothetical protein [Streptomyces sp. JH34]|uniref:hypothetical protein n=1 Tax=unclassified Streptomyces TaxID=2593676 RepID=UPI0023F66679|nr:hypothetical protein [Streptomyces sp. JH34]MDF6022875.1 hypothetical protein [Streptomyces sp. JH34]
MDERDPLRGTGVPGVLDATDDSGADIARPHTAAFRAYATGLLVAVGRPEESALAHVHLAEGVMVTAAVSGTPEPARQAGRAAARLLADSTVSCFAVGVRTRDGPSGLFG